jgi:hypothetical protein
VLRKIKKGSTQFSQDQDVILILSLSDGDQVKNGAAYIFIEESASQEK